MMNSFRRICCALKLKHFLSVRCRSAYVQDVRSNMNFNRSDLNVYSFHEGTFLVITSDKKEALISRNTEKLQDIDVPRISYEELKTVGVNVENNATFLGFENGKPLFVTDLVSESLQCKNLLSQNDNRMFMPLRRAFFYLSNNPQMALLSKCYALSDWKLKHQFCSHCGNVLEKDFIRAQKKCKGCNTTHYPRISPVGITLVSNDKNDKVLLVRQPVHPPKMFTCIAGFIEPGESLEENVRREVAEEVGLEACNIQYIESQHWPIPGSSLMLGCFATVTDVNFTIDPSELEAADWFDRTQLQDAFDRISKNKEKLLKNADGIWIPPPGAIAYSLIKRWLEMF